MQIRKVRLKTGDLAAVRNFYHTTLMLPLVGEGADSLTVQAGTTHLTFVYAAGWQGRYHAAFDVPENRIAEAAGWIKTRARLATLNGETILQSSDHWNANMVYFYDAEGNILEFIARHNQPNRSNAPFDENSIIAVSEIGLGTRDVRATAASLCTQLGLAVYDGAGSDTFTAVGDEQGLVIVVKEGRSWYPNTGIPAGLYPVDLTLQGNTGAELILDGHRIRVKGKG